MQEVVLKAEHMYKEFGATKAITDVSIEVKSGVVLGLIGENGSGKSTLSSMIAGVYPPTAGEMFLHGKPYSPKSVLDARDHGVQYLTQEQGTIDGTSVAENMFLGKETQFSKGGFVNIRKLNTKAKEILTQNGMEEVDPTKSIDFYSFEDRKMIETARALSSKPDILIIDETTTALSQKGRNKIYEIIKDQKELGTAVIVISHDLDEVKLLCDEVVVLRDGQYIATLTGDDVVPEKIREKMIGRELGDYYYRIDTDCSYEDHVVFEVRDLTVDGLFYDISFDLHKGEILGIGGLSECGMHELLKTCFGAIKPTKGTVFVPDLNAYVKDTSFCVKNSIAYIPKDRDKESLFQATSIRDNIVAASLDRIKKGIFISPKAENTVANKEAAQMEVKMQNVRQLAKDLSGGNKQKVVIAKWLANKSNIFIMDCPTRGIDIGVKEKIYRLMEDLKARGIAILMVSEEMTELLGMSDRIITMKDGRINGEFRRSADLSESDIIKAIV